jgi:hypothetical protein
MHFKQFIEMSEEEENIHQTLSKLPKLHQSLVKDFKIKFLSNNTLKDRKHVGYVDTKKKEIAVAAPWNYGREFTILHEIAHRVWEKLNSNYKQEWKKIVTPTKDNVEELFCMAYAATYSNYPPAIYDKQEWKKFIKGLK